MPERTDEISGRGKDGLNLQDVAEGGDPADADLDRVVRGVGGTATPKAKRVRPLAGLILILLVVAAAAYMQHGLKNRNMKKSAQVDASRSAAGPATTSEKSWMDDQARLGLDTGADHLSALKAPRPSIIAHSSVPSLEYTPAAVSGGGNETLSFAEQRRLDLYKQEQEAIESGTSIRAASNSYGQAQQGTSPAEAEGDPLQVIQGALIRARADQDAAPAPALAGQARRNVNEDSSDYERQNGQADKGGFTAKTNVERPGDYLSRARTAALGKFELQSGWLVPAVLEQELNSDLPGLIRALVRENVYDSVTGQYLLIPAGSTIVGIYNSHVGYGQSALQAVWKRIIFPDGSSLDLGGFEGDDSQGAAGFRDQVDSHWVRLLSGALLTSVFAAGIELSQGQNSSVLQSQSVTQQAGAAVGQQVGQLGVEVTRRNLNIQPTIRIRPGYRFFVRVEKDILFQGPYTPMRAGE